jgi:hypothetical protein
MLEFFPLLHVLQDKLLHVFIFSIKKKKCYFAVIILVTPYRFSLTINFKRSNVRELEDFLINDCVIR